MSSTATTPALFDIVTFTATHSPHGGNHQPVRRSVRIVRLPTERRPTFGTRWILDGFAMDGGYEFTVAQMAEIVAVAS